VRDGAGRALLDAQAAEHALGFVNVELGDDPLLGIGRILVD
jgi:hypothetical protein